MAAARLPHCSVSDGELEKKRDEVERGGDDEEVFVSDDEQLRIHVDEILERMPSPPQQQQQQQQQQQNSNNNNKFEDKPRRSEEEGHGESEEDENAGRESANTRRRLHQQIGISPAVLPTGSPIKAYHNPAATGGLKVRRSSSKRALVSTTAASATPSLTGE